MPSYCLKCIKNTKSINPRVSNSVMVKQWYQNVLYVVVKNQDLFKNKTQVEY